MSSKRFILAGIGFCMLAGAAAYGDDLVIKGVRFEDATVQSSDEGITIVHKKGVCRFAFGDLPEDIRSKYGYDEVKCNASLERKHAQMIAQVRSADGSRFFEEAKRVARAKALDVQLEVVQLSDGIALAKGIAISNAMKTEIKEEKIPVSLRSGLRTWYGKGGPPSEKFVIEKHPVQTAVRIETPMEAFVFTADNHPYIVGSALSGMAYWCGSSNGHECYAMNLTVAADKLVEAARPPPAASNAPPVSSSMPSFGVGVFHGVSSPLRGFGVFGMQFLPIGDRNDPYRYGIVAGVVLDLLVVIVLLSSRPRDRRKDR